MYSGKIVVFWQSGCIRAKVVLFGKVVVFEQKLLYSDKVVVFGQSGCIFAKVVLFGLKWLCWGKSGCIRAKMVVFGQSGCTR